MAKMKPFENEEEAIQIDDLTIENRLDRIQMYGSVHLTKDKVGLMSAKALKEILDLTVEALEKEKSLPEKISLNPTDTTENPFK